MTDQAKLEKATNVMIDALCFQAVYIYRLRMLLEASIRHIWILPEGESLDQTWVRM